MSDAIDERERFMREQIRLARLIDCRDALARLVAAKDEKDAHGETGRYRELKDGAWERVRGALDPDPAPLGWYEARDGSAIPATRDPVADLMRREGYTTSDGGTTWTKEGAR